MLARSCTRCVARARGPAFRTNMAPARAQCRRYATPSGAAASSAPGNGAGVLAPLVSELDRMAPSFDVRGEDIRILQTPADFYETLKVRTREQTGSGAHGAHGAARPVC